MREGRRNICVCNVYYLAYTWFLPRDVAAILQNFGALGCSLFVHLESGSDLGFASVPCLKVRGN